MSYLFLNVRSLMTSKMCSIYVRSIKYSFALNFYSVESEVIDFFIFKFGNSILHECYFKL